MTRNLLLRSLAAAAIGFALAPWASAQTDDFNDKLDDGWIRYDPLAAFGAPGAFSFPNGGYELHSSSSPNPAQLGPGRVASLRLDATYSKFSVSADVVDWDTSIDQAFGLLGRISQLGLGTSDGYVFLYRPFKGDFLIERLDNESGALIGSGAFLLDHAQDYRFTFSGEGSSFTGSVFNLANPGTALFTVSATDSTYASGANGLLVTTNAPKDLGPGDATFDNYRSVVPEPSTIGLALSGLLLGVCGRWRRNCSV